MFDFLFSEKREPQQWTLDGRHVRMLYGFSATKQHPRDFDPGFLNSDSTLILGSREGKSAGVWHFAIDIGLLKNVDNGFIVIASERVHGGLHTRQYGTAARVLFNEQQKDYIRLKGVADQHTDYFHRPSVPDFPKLWPISACATVYAWHINAKNLEHHNTQILRLELDQHATWDIDYVAIVLIQKKREIRDEVKEIAFLVLGAVLGAIAALIFGA